MLQAFGDQPAELKNHLCEPGPVFWALRSNVGIQKWGNVPFGAPHAGEVTLCVLMRTDPLDCFVLSLSLSRPAECSNLQSTVVLGHSGKCFGAHGFITGWIFAYSFQVLNSVHLIGSVHSLAFDQCHTFNHISSNPASTRCSLLLKADHGFQELQFLVQRLPCFLVKPPVLRLSPNFSL